MDARRPAHLISQGCQPRTDDPTVDEFVGEWWDRHAEVVYTQRDLVTAVPILVRWILPHLGQARVRTICAETLASFADEITTIGATCETTDACFDILDEVLTCAAGWRVIPQSPLDDPDITVWPCRPAGEVVPFPSRRSLSDHPDSA